MRTVVVKIGSNSLVDGQGRLDPRLVEGYADQLAGLAAGGLRPVLVTSGAVASGQAVLGLKERPPGLAERQALAAVGQISLMRWWESALARHGLTAAQLLLTHDDFTVRDRYLNLTATVASLTAFRSVPVINENDPVAVQELTVGDNDRLSALVAALVGAERLVLLTDIDGVYDADPRTHAGAKLVPEIPAVTPRLLAAAGGASARGRGGMRSKLEAARLAAAAGVTTHIAHAKAPDVLARILAGDAVGTRIPGRADAADARKRWLAVARKVKGQLRVDAGAATAIRERGRSLLPAGIVRVDGRFERGDTVAIVDGDGEEVARGLASMSSTELTTVAGKRMDAAATALGYALPPAAVHRDNLLVL
jgi:glutamate 5-kinase